MFSKLNIYLVLNANFNSKEEHQPCIWMRQQMGSCCDAGLGFVWHCYCIDMTFVCLNPQKRDLFWTFEGLSMCRIQKYDKWKKKIHYELIKSINNPSWLIQMQGWCSSLYHANLLWCHLCHWTLKFNFFYVFFSE